MAVCPWFQSQPGTFRTEDRGYTGVCFPLAPKYKVLSPIWLPAFARTPSPSWEVLSQPVDRQGSHCTAREATASHHFNHEKWDFSSFFFVGGESFVINQNLPVSCGLGKNHCSSLRGRRAAGHVCVPKCPQVLRVASGLRSTVLALPAFPPVSRAPSQRPA